MSSRRQQAHNLKGEVIFRRKLALQHTTGERVLPDYLGKDEHDRILAERVQTTVATFQTLREKGVDFSSFLELGAERGHRSLALVNAFSAKGFAADISLDQLRTATYFSHQFNLPLLPARVCCDANQLPFRRGTIPFVFAYQFLHHFPALDVVMAEIYRVMSRGTFFFDEEPMGRMLQWHLYQQGKKEYSRFNLRKGKFIRWLEGFISEACSDEVEHGVIENHAMPMEHWRDNLQRFDDFDVMVRTLRHLKSRMTRENRLANLPNRLLGGVIYGLCHKRNAISGIQGDPVSWLCCPSCRLAGMEDAGLVRSGDKMVCAFRECSYPIVDDIPILIEPELRRQLYPEFG